MNLKHIVDSIYKNETAGGDVQSYIDDLLDSLLCTTDASIVRNVIPDFSNWTIPTRIQLAMHVHLLSLPDKTPEDVLRFADFLDIFYEEMSEWSRALRRSLSNPKDQN